MSRFSLRCVGRFVLFLIVIAWFFLSLLLSQLPVSVETIRGSLIDIQPRAALVIPNQQSALKAGKTTSAKSYNKTNQEDMWFYHAEFNFSIWDTDSGHDRILAQLAYAKQLSKEITNETKPKIILVYPGGGSGQNPFEEQRCPVKQCVITHKTMDARIADAVVFSNTNSFPGFPKKPNQIWVYYRLESPQNTPVIPASAKINWTATYRRDSTIVTPYEKFVPYDPQISQIPQSRDYAIGKTKMVAWFVSNCKAANNRLQYANELGKYTQVDIYGRCGPLKCQRKAKDDTCFKMLSTDYRFYLAFENSNCKDYITEKFYWNGLWNNVIPIVMGARSEEYRKMAPPHSYIHVDDFTTPRDLADFLDTLAKNDTLYNEYFKWKGTGTFINTKFWCRLCAMVHGASKRPPTWYESTEKWWRQDKCRRVPWNVEKEEASSQ